MRKAKYFKAAQLRLIQIESRDISFCPLTKKKRKKMEEKEEKRKYYLNK